MTIINFNYIHEYLKIDQADISIEVLLGNSPPFSQIGTTKLCDTKELERWVVRTKKRQAEIHKKERDKKTKNTLDKILYFIEKGGTKGRRKSDITARFRSISTDERNRLLNTLILKKLVRLEHDKRSRRASAVYISKEGWISRNLEQRKEKEKLGTWTAEEFDAAYTEHLRARLANWETSSTSDEQRDVHAGQD